MNTDHLNHPTNLQLEQSCKRILLQVALLKRLLVLGVVGLAALEGRSAAVLDVVPQVNTTTPGGGYSASLSQVFRFQQLYPAHEFPPVPIRITSLSWRRFNTETFQNASGQYRFKLSTTSKTESTLGSVFDQNIGPDETIVFDGTWTVSSMTTQTNPPYPFEMVLNLTTPFVYDPTKGNLLVEHQCFSTTVPYCDAAGGVGDGLARAYNTSLNPNATTASMVDTGGDIIQFEYTPLQDIVFIPTSSTFTNSLNVTLLSGVPNSVIRYTTNGSDPTETSTAYTAPIILNATTTVKAQLYVNSFPASDVFSQTYTSYVRPDIEFMPVGQLFTNQLTVTLVNNVGVGTLRYTMDGSAPQTASTAYTGPINITTGVTIRAQVFLNTFPVSEVFQQTYARVYAFPDDGIPFAWRETHFGAGFLTDPRSAAHADPDNDGYTNVEEYLSGTVPVDNDSVPEIELAVKAVPRLTFSTVQGRNYRIDRATKLNPPDWQTIVNSVSATGQVMHYVDEEAPANSFYRIELIP